MGNVGQKRTMFQVYRITKSGDVQYSMRTTVTNCALYTRNKTKDISGAVIFLQKWQLYAIFDMLIR